MERGEAGGSGLPRLPPGAVTPGGPLGRRGLSGPAGGVWRAASPLCSSGSGDGSAARACTLGWKMVTEPEAAPALKHSFFAGRTQARSRSNVLSVDEASSPRECSRHTSERTPASSRSSVWSVMGLSPPAGACGGTWAPTTTSVPTCVPTARRHLRPR